jgi:hypothetical protein
MKLNQCNGPVNKYYEQLLNNGIIKESDNVLVDPRNEKEFPDINDLVILQQGDLSWNVKNFSKIKYIFTPSLYLYEKYSYSKKIFLIPFAIEPEYKKISKWSDRENALYYHGRIISEKLGIIGLTKLCSEGIKIVLRGPICKEYWTDKDIERPEFISYKEKVSKLNIEFLPPTDDKEVIINDLNKYKFYFTLSNGECFNLALQEAIACGTIPLVKPNFAYWWAEHLILQFENTNELIKKFNGLKDMDMDEYSSLLSKELHKRFNYESLIKSYEYQKKELFP